MSNDYEREKQKGEVFGLNAIDTRTAGGRRAFDEHLVSQQSGGGGSILDGYILLGVAALIIFPVGLMALLATLIFAALKRWPTLNGKLLFWSAFRRIYLASLAFAVTSVALLLVAKPFRNPFPIGSFQAIMHRTTVVGLACAVGLIASAWVFRRFALSLNGSWAMSFRAALAVILPACVITAVVLLAVFEPGAFG